MLELSPIAKHHPITCVSQFTAKNKAVVTPSFSLFSMAEAAASDIDEEDHLALLEWLSLVVLESPRVLRNDKIDPYLCQYEVPGGDRALETDIVVLSWRGFLTAEWITNLYSELL